VPSEVSWFLALLHDQGAAVAALVIVVTAWLRGWIYSAKEYQRQVDETDYWRRIAERALSIGEETQRTARSTIQRRGGGRQA
jgi:hypothetical protein